jgi:mannose-1-phosphate guanylyltransferase
MVRFLQGAILAAGYGERMQANGSALPKPLVEVGGEPLLLRQARLMAAAGVRRVIAVVNSKTFDFIGKHLPQL